MRASYKCGILIRLRPPPPPPHCCKTQQLLYPLFHPWSYLVAVLAEVGEQVADLERIGVQQPVIRSLGEHQHAHHTDGPH